LIADPGPLLKRKKQVLEVKRYALEAVSFNALIDWQKE